MSRGAGEGVSVAAGRREDIVWDCLLEDDELAVGAAPVL